MDGISVLLDGLCQKLWPYMETPEPIFQDLLRNPPDALCFTHWHADHFSEPLAAAFCEKNSRPIFGPERLPYATNFSSGMIGGVRITPVVSRHLGKMEKGLSHVSYVLQGTKCVWFMGDAAPIQWRSREDLPRPDVVIAPFAYGTTETAWKLTASLADQVVLVHMPREEEDPHGLWPLVRQVTGKIPGPPVVIPQMGQKIGI